MESFKIICNQYNYNSNTMEQTFFFFGGEESQVMLRSFHTNNSRSPIYDSSKCPSMCDPSNEVLRGHSGVE